MDEVFIRIRGKQHYLWRAVNQDGNVLDILVQSRRNAAAATRFFRNLLKGLRYVPRVIVTDKLKSYAAANVRSCRRSSTAKAAISITALRCRISRHDDESDR
jgi:transposase-like protein